MAAVAAACLNPYGPRLLRFLLETATVARPDIVEWQPVNLAKTEGLAYLASRAFRSWRWRLRRGGVRRP